MKKNREKLNKKCLKRAMNRAIDSRSKITMFVLAGFTCKECEFNSENEKKLSNNYAWSVNCGVNKKRSAYCKKYLKPYKFSSDNICNMFKEIDIK